MNEKERFGKSLKREWGKIVWEPLPKSLRKTALVAIAAAALGFITMALDTGFMALIKTFVLS